MKLLHRASLVPPLLVLMATAWGCSTSPVTPRVSSHEEPIFLHEAAPGRPAPGQVGTEGGSTLGKTGFKVIDGSKGGDLSVGNWQVKVPKGAYAGKATITIRTDSSEIALCHLTISPPSLNAFRVPVTLKYHVPSEMHLMPNDVLWWDPHTQAWRVVTSGKDKVAHDLYAYLSHFSIYGIGKLRGKAGW